MIQPVGTALRDLSIGPLPCTQVQVLRQEADGNLGEACNVGELGLIAISGDHVSPGYRDPKHNKDVFNLDLLNSGDLG